MNIRDISSEFKVYVFSQDADIGSRIKFALTMNKYETYFFADLEEMYVRLDSDPAHVVILDQASIITSLSDVFQKVLSYSSEIKILCLASEANLNDLNMYREYNMVQYFDRAKESTTDQVVMSVDQCCESLYRLYQNEQVYNLYNTGQEQLNQLKTQIEELHQAPKARPFQMRIAEYRSAESKEALLQAFYQQTPNQAWVFLKFVKSIRTFVALNSQNMPESWIEGLSFKIPSSLPDFNDKIIVGDYPEVFLNYLRKKWDVTHVKVLPLICKSEVEGLFVSTQDISAEVAEDFSLLSLIYNLILLEAQPKNLDVEDSLTGFYNQHFYKRILDKEVDRSKRSFTPLSVIKVAVDIFREIEVSHGKSFCDEIIKKVADVIKSTSRLPDYACRTSDNEFSILLTNCNRKGAALRAERLRQQLKTESFSKSGILVTVSQGISEYPSLTRSAEALDESARKALDFIATKGGDKICIHKAAQDHRPDFQVNT